MLPSDRDNSYLFQIINGAGIGGSVMPPPPNARAWAPQGPLRQPNWTERLVNEVGPHQPSMMKDTLFAERADPGACSARTRVEPQVARLLLEEIVRGRQGHRRGFS